MNDQFFTVLGVAMLWSLGLIVIPLVAGAISIFVADSDADTATIVCVSTLICYLALTGILLIVL